MSEVGGEAVATGKIIRYNEVKGYGFIAPDEGGDDLFIHVNDVDFPLNDRCVGLRVSYRVVDGHKGPKAHDVRYDPGSVTTAPAPRKAGPAPVAAGGRDEEDWEVIPMAQLNAEITELLMEVAPNLTGVQIMKIRERLVAAAFQRGWVDSD